MKNLLGGIALTLALLTAGHADDALLLNIAQDSMGAARGSATAKFYGWGFADSFGAVTYVDVAHATGLDASAAGALSPTAAGGSDTSATPSGNSGNAGYTFIVRTFAAANNKTIASIGVFQQTASTLIVKIFKLNSTANYDVVFSESFSHPGGGWADHALGTPYAVPSTGTYYAGVYSASTGFSDESPIGTVSSWKSGNITGTGQAFNEPLTNYAPAVRVTYSGSTANMTVASTAIPLEGVPSSIYVAVRVKHVDAATAGTDYTLQVSRDGGAHFTAPTLLDNFTDLEDNAHVVTATADVSGQPSGQSLILKLIGANNKMIQLCDWYAHASP